MANYRRIYEQHYGVKIPRGYHIHHKDFNHKNDDPLNLECLHKDDHAKKHGFLSAFIMASNRARGIKHSPESRHKRSIRMMGNKRASGTTYKHTEEQNKKQSLNRKGKKLGPNGSKRTSIWKQEHSERIKLWHSTRKGLTILG